MTDDRNALEDIDGGELPAEAVAELTSWAASDPPAGFVDRVVAATHRGAPPAPVARRRRRSIGAIAAAAIAAAASLVLLRGSDGAALDGARVVQDRETLSLGARGVAVAEPGAELTWTIAASGAALIHQTRGDVFYRVENGGPFVVETPYGRVIVRGTCFRVEVRNMNVSRQTWIGSAVGAAVAATIVIAVYEGRVRVVNARGHADATAGERIALGAGAAPAKLDGAPSNDLAAIEPPPPGSATVPELLWRDQSHRGEIALLRARVRALESGTAAAPDDDAALDHRAGKRKIFDLGPDELADMARNCEIRFDIPGYGIEPRLMTDKLAELDHLSADDRAIYDRTARQENERYMTALRALYQELSGSDGSDLDARAMYMEIYQKSPAADVEAARKRLAEERAGLAAPPADPRSQSVVDRMFRLQTALGNSLEQLLAAELGAGKAHQIRQNGWPGGDDSILYGCPD